MSPELPGLRAQASPAKEHEDLGTRMMLKKKKKKQTFRANIATFNDAKPRLKVVSCSVNEFVVNTNPTWARRVTPP